MRTAPLHSRGSNPKNLTLAELENIVKSGLVRNLNNNFADSSESWVSMNISTMLQSFAPLYAWEPVAACQILHIWSDAHQEPAVKSRKNYPFLSLYQRLCTRALKINEIFAAKF